jgi:hypothetical protein
MAMSKRLDSGHDAALSNRVRFARSSRQGPCRPLDAGVTVQGVIRERTLDGSHPLGDATVELYHGGFGTPDDAMHRGVVNSVIASVEGRYAMCLPFPDGPPGPAAGSGFTGPAGEISC